MSPELFAGTSAEDETDLCRALDPIVRRERFATHRNTYVTDRDFAYLAARGIDFVRLPVPYFVFGDVAPFEGRIDHVDRAFAMANRYGIRVLVDLHTVPDSQNGFDNGGMRGVCKFHQDPAHVAFALDVLEQLTRRYRDDPALWGIEVLNEPISAEIWEMLDLQKQFPPSDPDYARGSEPVPTTFLKQFYRSAYERIRAVSDDVTVVFHDGFRMPEWVGFLREPDFRGFVVDTHLYLLERMLAEGDTDLEGILEHIDRTFGGTLREMSAHFPILVGEWSLDPYSKQAYPLTGEARVDYYRALANAQMRAFEPAVGWSYWAYRLHTDVPRYDAWDFLKAVETGLLPAGLAAD